MEHTLPGPMFKHPVADYIRELLTNISTNYDIPSMKLLELVDYKRLQTLLSVPKGKAGICQARKQDGAAPLLSLVCLPLVTCHVPFTPL